MDIIKTQVLVLVYTTHSRRSPALKFTNSIRSALFKHIFLDESHIVKKEQLFINSNIFYHVTSCLSRGYIHFLERVWGGLKFYRIEYRWVGV